MGLLESYTEVEHEQTELVNVRTPQNIFSESLVQLGRLLLIRRPHIRSPRCGRYSMRFTVHNKCLHE
jgi:hypothetical protein